MNKNLIIDSSVIEKNSLDLLTNLGKGIIDDQVVDEEININDYMIDEEINIDDYVPVDKDENLVEFGLLNVFTCYYKQLYQTNQEVHMLDGIDVNKKDSTNRCIELLYEEMYKFRISVEQDKDVLYDPDDDFLDIESCNELYILHIDGDAKFASKYMMPLLRYTSDLDWINIEWSIIKIKG